MLFYFTHPLLPQRKNTLTQQEIKYHSSTYREFTIFVGAFAI